MSGGPMLKAPVFLVGTERSGTSLLRLMLDGHPELSWNQEFEYAVDLMPAEGGFPSLHAYREHLGVDRVFLLSEHRIDPELGYRELVNSFLLQKRGDKRLVGGTVHRHFDRLLRIWPDARFIHIVRDGRDVARSMVEMGWAGNPWASSWVWMETERLWDRLVLDLPADRHMSLRFEELIGNPVGELTRICGFLDVKYHEGMLSYPARSDYGLPDVRMIARWKKNLSAQEVLSVEARIGPMLRLRGYELSVAEPPPVTALQERYLRWQDYLGRLRFRIGRFGLGLVVRDSLARHLGLKPWARKLRVVMNEIENKVLK